MSAIVPQPYLELARQRLALGLEPRDALTGGRIARPLDAVLEHPGATRLQRHTSGRFVLSYDRRVEPPLDVRLVPGGRRHVPRRMRFEIADLAAVKVAEAAGVDLPTTSRTWRPLLFPGAAGDVRESSTGARGRVTKAGTPVRWTRVEAKLGATVIARAHGDDRGEFLLVIGPILGAVGDLTPALAVTIVVYARDPVAPRVPGDPLSDLPLETAAAPGAAADPVSTGEQLPQHYVKIAELPGHPLPLGRLTSVPIHV